MTSRFGIFVLPVVESGSSQDAQQELQSAVDDIRFAEDAGFDAVWVAEHHGTQYGGVCPSALLLLAYAGAQTCRIRLGTAITILPLHDPVQLAEEVLLLDHLTRGRLELGVGSGFLGVDFATRGISIDSRGDRFRAGLAVLRQALTDQGPATPQAVRRLFPPKYGNSSVPIWGAATASREGIAAFADAGMGLMLNPYTSSPNELAGTIQFFHERVRALKRSGTVARVLIHEHLFVARTEREAYELPRDYLMKYLQSLRTASSEVAPPACISHSTGPKRYEEIFPERVAFGTPDQLIERIGRWMRRGVTDFAFSIRFGGMSTELARTSASLFCSAVAPRFRGQSAEGGSVA
ncbi:MAG: LLM class flavin-dependent oxidoreductase [Gemmatimonadales bacterium]|nr:LLM class flavin-dependent oxidoreductase [Gemmatimonadales bacterium]